MQIENNAVINRPAQEIFDYVTNLENASKWQTEVLEAQRTSTGPMGIGSTARYTFKLLGRHFDVTTEITEWDPPNSLSAKTTSGPFPASPGYTLAPDGNGTRFTLRIALEPGGFFKLAGPVLEPLLNRQAHADVEALKALLESG